MTTEDGKKGIIEQLETLLQKAKEELYIIKGQKKIVEDLLALANNQDNTDKKSFISESADMAVIETEKTVANINLILQQARDLAKADEESPDRPFINIKEIQVLKEFSDLVNLQGEAAEEAQAVRKAVSEIQNTL